MQGQTNHIARGFMLRHKRQRRAAAVSNNQIPECHPASAPTEV